VKYVNEPEIWACILGRSVGGLAVPRESCCSCAAAGMAPMVSPEMVSHEHGISMHQPKSRGITDERRRTAREEDLCTVVTA